MPQEHRLPPDLADQIVGTVVLPPVGNLNRVRHYITGYHPEVGRCGEHLTIVPDSETMSHSIETTIEIIDYPPDYFHG